MMSKPIVIFSTVFAVLLGCGVSNSKKDEQLGSDILPIDAASLTPKFFTSFQGDNLTGKEAAEEIENSVLEFSLPTVSLDPKTPADTKLKSPFEDQNIRDEQAKRHACLDKTLGKLKPFSTTGDTVNVKIEYLDACDGPERKVSYLAQLSCKGADFSSLNGKNLEAVLVPSAVSVLTFLLPVWQLCPKSATSVQYSQRFVFTTNSQVSPPDSEEQIAINLQSATLVSAADGKPCTFDLSSTGIQVKNCWFFRKISGGTSSSSGESVGKDFAMSIEFTNLNAAFYQGYFPVGEAAVTINGWRGKITTTKEQVPDKQDNLKRELKIAKGKDLHQSFFSDSAATIYRTPGGYTFASGTEPSEESVSLLVPLKN